MAGSWDAVEPGNFRHSYRSEDQALGYITEDVGFRTSDTFLYGIVRVRFAVLFKTANRKGWNDLSAQTRADYLGSSAAQSEARYHHMSVAEWYEYAPDLKAFRRKAKGRTGGEGITGGDTEYEVYIARRYKEVLSSEDATDLRASIHAAHERTKRIFKLPF